MKVLTASALQRCVVRDSAREQIRISVSGRRYGTRRSSCASMSWSNIRVTCSSGSKPDSKSIDRAQRVKEVENNLKQRGIDRATARRVLQIWKEAGATSPDALRKLFVQRSLNKSISLTIQLALDTFASLGAFYTAAVLGDSQAFGSYTLAVQYLAYFLGMYLGFSALLDVFGLGALVMATRRYSANADAFLLAVQQMAGQDSGLDVVNKARKAVSMVKVLQALQSILDMLQSKEQDGQEDFFKDLGAYLTLERAQRLYKFRAEDYGVSEEQAAEAAAVFAKYDTNDDGVLDISEFKQLCAETANHLSGEEVEAALGVLDTDSSGSIDFGEWVAWWVQKGQPLQVSQ